MLSMIFGHMATTGHDRKVPLLQFYDHFINYTEVDDSVSLRY